MRLRLFCLLAVLSLTTALYAQQETAPPRFQINAGYSYLSNSLNGVAGAKHGLSGFDAGVAFPEWHDLRFIVDVETYRGTNQGAPQHLTYFQGGAHYGKRLWRETVFGEAMGGTAGANNTWAGAGALGQTASFAAFIGAGVDTPIRPHLAVRVGGGYQYTYFQQENPTTKYPIYLSGLPTNFGRLSAGLVYSF